MCSLPDVTYNNLGPTVINTIKLVVKSYTGVRITLCIFETQRASATVFSHIKFLMWIGKDKVENLNPIYPLDLGNEVNRREWMGGLDLTTKREWRVSKCSTTASLKCQCVDRNIINTHGLSSIRKNCVCQLPTYWMWSKMLPFWGAYISMAVIRWKSQAQD